jgi:hypothetical protein
MFSFKFVERILELILLFLFREWRIDGIAIDWNLMNQVKPFPKFELDHAMKLSIFNISQSLDGNFMKLPKSEKLEELTACTSCCRTSYS